jgi:multidrug efflux pump subunit AcrA (membrane-fusion protein)
LAIFVVRWIVISNREPGVMTPLEAQGMDMTTMRSPSGVQPVGAEAAAIRPIGGESSYPGTVFAYSDEDVVARIPGRILAIPAYPGTRVKKGQLLVRLEADEYALQAAQSKMQGQAGLAMVSVAQKEVSRLQAMHDRIVVEIAAMAAAERKARADRTVAVTESLGAREKVKMKSADVQEAQAQLEYVEKDYGREQQLYKQGAISLDELQQSEKDRNATAARVQAAKSALEAEKLAADSAQGRIDAADAAVATAVGNHAAARKRAEESQREIAKAAAEVEVSRADAKAAASGAGSARIISGYREMRALDNAVVSERLISPGSLVQPGQTILRLKVVDRVRVQARVPVDKAASLHPGDMLTIRVGKAAHRGTVTSVFPAADPATRTVTVEAVLQNKSGDIIPGAFVQVSISSANAEPHLSVRKKAVFHDSFGGAYVWVVAHRPAEKSDWTCVMHPHVSEDGPGKCPICGMPLTRREAPGTSAAEFRKVEVGGSDGEYTAILSGIKVGEKIIYAGANDLRGGIPVQVVPWGESGPKSLPKGTAGG